MKKQFYIVSANEGTLATVTWDGERVTLEPHGPGGKNTCDWLAGEVLGPTLMGPYFTIEDGEPFFNAIPRLFRRNPYVQATEPREVL